ncbi:MAG: hypothetical protein GC192_17055 [Bacteroidetes bacterium]|nr:hypothetical protein [Bacteroidota bacterium]
MLEFKVIRLIQALLSKELSTVERYLFSPNVSSNDECARLFIQICKFHPNFDNPKLTKERLFAKLFGKQPYNDGKMRKLMTQLTQAIEQYLMETELKKSEELQTKLLAKALSGRDSYKLFSEVVQSRLKVLDKGMDRGRNYFRESFELSDMLYFHPGSVKLTKKDEYLSRAIDDFERYFTLVMLQNEADTIVGTRMVSSIGTGAHYVDEVLKNAGLPLFSRNKAIRLFHQLVTLLKGKEVENLEELKATSFETFLQLSQFEMDLAINLLRNFAIPYANKGNMEYARFVFDLYKFELERGFFANTISVGAFINIVTLALAIDEIAWVKHFIENYSIFLPTNEKDNASRYCWGIWHYQRGVLSDDIEEYYNALQYFNLIPTKSGVNYEIRIRSAFLRVQFELLEKGREQLDDIFNQTRNFERHLRGNNQYALQIRDGYLNFLKYYKSLVRMYENKMISEKSLNSLIMKLDNEDENVYFKPWLIGKAKGLNQDD